MLLEDALNKINARIASLEKTLQAKIDDLEHRFTRAFENPRKPCVQVSTPSASTPALVSITASSTLPKSILDFSWTPLMHAAASGDVEVARKHLSDKDKKNSDGETALMIAARAKHEKIVELLDPTDDKGVTALMRAASRGDIEMVRTLIPFQKGMTDIVGNMAFIYAFTNNHTDTAILLRNYEAPSWTHLMCAAFVGNIEMARKHLSDKDKRNSDGDTALMIAAREGYEDIVELLDPTDENGTTALMRATIGGDIELVKLLAPLQEEMKNSEGYTALMFAAKAGNKNLVELLDPIDDEDSITALMRAAEEDDIENVKLLTPSSGEKETGICRGRWMGSI